MLTSCNQQRQVQQTSDIQLSSPKTLKESIKYFTQVIQMKPNEANAYYQRGLANYKLDNKQAALEDFTQAIKIKPENSDAYYQRGLVHYSLDDYSTAVNDYTQAIKLNPSFAEAYLERGRAIDGKYYTKDERAIADYTRAIELNPKLAEAYYRRSLHRWSDKDFNKEDSWMVLQDLNKAIELNLNCDAAYYRRIFARQVWNRDWNKGSEQQLVKDNLKDLAQIIKINPDWELFGEEPFAGNECLSKDRQAQIENLSEKIQITTNGGNTYYSRGFVYFKARDEQKAIKDFTQAIQLNSQDSHAYYYRGLARYREEDIKGAIEDYTRAIDLNPNLAEAYAFRGLAQYQLGDKQGAVVDSTNGIKIAGGLPQAYIVRGLALNDLGDTVRAENDAHQAIKQLPGYSGTSNGGSARKTENPNHFYALGDRLARRGAKQAAIQSFQEAQRLGHPKAAARIRELQSQ